MLHQPGCCKNFSCLLNNVKRAILYINYVETITIDKIVIFNTNSIIEY